MYRFGQTTQPPTPPAKELYTTDEALYVIDSLSIPWFAKLTGEIGYLFYMGVLNRDDFYVGTMWKDEEL